MLFFDGNYLLYVFLPAIVLSLGAQAFLMLTYRKWSKTANSRNMTGMQVGDYLVRNTNLMNVNFEGTPGRLSDHYDPQSHTVRMSQDIATQPSVASMAIVAHELGHAQQHQEESALIAMRSFLVPAMTISPNVAMILIFAGLFFNFTGLIQLGILFFAVVVVFMLLTLPVEIDASRRGLQMMTNTGLIVNDEERGGARAVLTAAAMTYVAAAVQAVLQLIYFIGLSRD